MSSSSPHPHLYIIRDINDPWIKLIAHDPVRPELPIEFRVSSNSEIFVWMIDNTTPGAVVCAAYRNSVPASVDELALVPATTPNVAVFYTIWSYVPGAGRKLILNVRDWLQTHSPNISDFVTLSPPTDMARVFHLRNGAQVYRINSDTVNYQYH